MPIPVGSARLDVDYAVEHYPIAQVVFVTPSYQYPLGITMRLDQRLRLLDWAEKTES
jgi:GntR family transcriptional regulator/MocR family aminotransferase